MLYTITEKLCTYDSAMLVVITHANLRLSRVLFLLCISEDACQTQIIYCLCENDSVSFTASKTLLKYPYAEHSVHITLAWNIRLTSHEPEQAQMQMEISSKVVSTLR